MILKKIIMLNAACIVSLAGLFAQTYIQNHQEVSGNWSKSGSPYIIQGEATVPYGQTLTIGPGVLVKFKTGSNQDVNSGCDKAYLRVLGKLKANGDKNEPILFTRDGDDGKWGIVAIIDSKNDNSITYCVFEHGGSIYNIATDLTLYAVLSVSNSTVTIQNNVFVNNDNTCIDIRSSKVRIYNNIFAKSTAGILAYASSTLEIDHNTIVDNYYGVWVKENSSATITNCIIHGNNNAFDLSDGTTTILKYSLVQDNELSSLVTNKGNNLLGRDPNFTDKERFNYSLQNSSPAIRKASDGKDMGCMMQ